MMNVNVNIEDSRLEAEKFNYAEYNV